MTMISQNHQRFMRDFISLRTRERSVRLQSKNALPTRLSRIYLRGVGFDSGKANVAEGEADGEDVDAPFATAVDVGDGETVGVGEGVGVGGGGIIFSQ